MNKQTFGGESERSACEMHSLPFISAARVLKLQAARRSFFLLVEKMHRHIQKKPPALFSLTHCCENCIPTYRSALIPQWPGTGLLSAVAEQREGGTVGGSTSRLDCSKVHAEQQVRGAH